jgi:hypothetical protein
MAQKPKREVKEKWVFQWEQDVPEQMPIAALIARLKIIQEMYPDAYAVDYGSYDEYQSGLAVRVEESEEDYQARLEVWAKREKDRIDKQLIKARRHLDDLEKAKNSL